MLDDPIIQEVRQIRDQLAARFDYDVMAIGAYYQALQKEKNLPVVSRQSKRPTTGNQSEAGFEPIQVQGQPLSEVIIEERRNG